MTSTIAGPNIVSSEYKRDPFSFWARLRVEMPVARVAVPSLGDAWFLTRHQDVVGCLMDDRRFRRNPEGVGAADTAALAPLVAPPHAIIGPNMLDLDGTAHRRLRTLSAKWFTRKAVEKWRPQTEKIASMLLDAMAERTDVDLVADYALPLPLAVIGAMYGISIKTMGELDEWTKIVQSRRDKPGRLSVADPESEFNKWVKELYRARRAKPVDDLAGTLSCGTKGVEPLDEREFVAMVDFLLFSGHQTTANLIGSSTLALLENSTVVTALIDDRELLRRAIEELLRFCAPVDMALARFVSEDTVLGGVCLRRGDFVFPIIASANRDEAQFDEPDRPNLPRDPNPHIAFGAGIHHCIGLHLARMEIEIAISALFRRYPRLSLVNPSASLAWRSVNIVRGLQALPVRLGTPRSL
jgi:cytochrome P450